MAIDSPMRPGSFRAPISDQHAAVHPGFWQQKFAQNILPLLTSLIFHLGLLILGLLTYGVVRHLNAPRVMDRAQEYVPTGGFDFGEKSLLPVGTNHEDRKATQNNLPEVPPESNGWADHRPDASKILSANGGSSGGADSVIGIGSSQAFSPGQHGLVNGPGGGTDGSSEGNGPVAEFGPSRFLGGAISRGIFNIPGAGRQGRQRIVFICDGTGSMMPQFDNLRVEIRKAIDGLRPPQSFNVVFFQEDAPPPVDKALLFASPDNKRKMYDYIDTFTPRGNTDPVPAIKTAFAMHPEVIYFLCDPTDFPDPKGTIALFKKLNVGGAVHVNTLAFLEHNDEGEDTLKTIATDGGGIFKYVANSDLGK